MVLPPNRFFEPLVLACLVITALSAGGAADLGRWCRRAAFTATAANGQNHNSQQIAAAALGQRFGELGERWSVDPEHTWNPGYRFVVMHNKGMHLQPYVDRLTADNPLPVNLGPMVRRLVGLQQVKTDWHVSGGEHKEPPHGPGLTGRCASHLADHLRLRRAAQDCQHVHHAGAFV